MGDTVKGVLALAGALGFGLMALEYDSGWSAAAAVGFLLALTTP